MMLSKAKRKQRETALSRLEEAEKLEELRFNQLINDENTEERKRQAEINAKMASQGVYQSGNRLWAICELRAAKVRRLIDERVRMRKELCRNVPELCSQDSLKRLLTQLSSMIGHSFTGLLQTELSQLNAPVANAFHKETEDLELQLRAHANFEIEILMKEVALDLHKKETPVQRVSVAGERRLSTWA